MGLLRLLRERFGPAIIIAAVVLGPGSILTSSKVGCQYGYAMLWVIIGAGLLMIGSTALSARLGASLDKTPCGELAEHLGRPVSVFIGVVLFLVVAAFQSSNNIAVIAAIEPYLSSGDQTEKVQDEQVEVIKSEQEEMDELKRLEEEKTRKNRIKTGILLLVNLIVIAALFGMKQLYAGLEKLMIALMTIMVVGFGINLFFAQPSLSGLLSGLIPSFPDVSGGWLPRIDPPLGTEIVEGVKQKVVDPYWAVQGMTATTFSIAGAFYQAYLVKEKGWTKSELSKGLMDSITGIAALGLTTMMIMCTAAAVLHGNIDASELKSVTDVASSLRPLFGDFASILFVLGIFAGAFSSFLVNAAIGGVLLSDGLGLGASLDQKWPKIFTVAALMFGMVVAYLASVSKMDHVALIVFAQALTVLGSPALAASLIYLAIGKPFKERVNAPGWMLFLVIFGFAIVTLLAIRTAVKIYLTVQLW